VSYPIIIADPPWAYYGSGTKDQAAAKHYNCLTVEQMLSLPWPLANPGILFMWATSPKLDDAMRLGGGLGLHYRGIAFVWVKARRDGGGLVPIGAQGVRPSIVKPTTEIVLAFSTQRNGRPLRLLSESVRQVVMAERVGHSQKPREVQDRITQLYGPDVPKLEMFARERYPGWDAWGDQLK
jgi:site-specific DNA-methyltransferase (adenine-specific)